MAAIPFVGKCFTTADQFLDYLNSIKFGAWRPRFVTMHHTGSPNLAVWRGWQTRAKPVTDEQWMKNLAAYYGNEMHWSAGPHFFFTPAHFCVLSLPDRKGVHAVSFNALSWGVECVGDFDAESFTPEIANRYAEGLACLHVATGMSPGPYAYQQRGLHFHRDDPKTSKTCPGKKVGKEFMIKLVQQHITALTGGSHEDDNPPEPIVPKARTGIVIENDLNIRTDAGGKFPVVGELDKGTKVTIAAETKNGDTSWYQIDKGWIAARYVKLDP